MVASIESQIQLLRERLYAAEEVCVIMGRTAPAGREEADDALTQAWINWSRLYGKDSSAQMTKEEWDQRIRELAEDRHRIREATLAKFRSQ